MKSSLTLADVTVIDHAYIDNTGMIVGGSFQPSFIIKGNVEEKENVVVDFSTIKKDIKLLIDHKDNGYDHKLWVIAGYSKVTKYDVVGDVVSIETPFVTLEVPLSAIKVIEDVPLFTPSYDNDFIATSISLFLQHALNQVYPVGEIEVETVIRTNCHTFSPQLLQSTIPFMFRYSHGLKDSTSWGCQNIAHGHLSYIVGHHSMKDMSMEQTARQSRVLNEMSKDLDNMVFINKANIDLIDEEGNTYISYQTQRGHFGACYNKDVRQIHLETETTIEFIAEYVKSVYGEILKDVGIESLTVSEGLSKGAYVEL